MNEAKKVTENVRRINALVSEEVYGVLVGIAARKGTTITEVLRQAIGLEKWFFEAQLSGARILIERDGKTNEVVVF